MENLNEYEIYRPVPPFYSNDSYQCSACDWRSHNVVMEFINRFKGVLVRYSYPICKAKVDLVRRNF